MTIGHVQHEERTQNKSKRDRKYAPYPRALIISPRFPGCDMLGRTPRNNRGSSGASWEASGEIYSTVTQHAASISPQEVKTVADLGPRVSVFVKRYNLRCIFLEDDQGSFESAADEPRFHIVVYGSLHQQPYCAAMDRLDSETESSTSN